MGLFGFVKKGLGSVLKFGASKVTHGLSDKVLSKLKSQGKAKAMAKAIAARTAATNQQAIAALKLAPTVTYGDALRRTRSKNFKRDLLEAAIPAAAFIEKPGYRGGNGGTTTATATKRKAPARRKKAAPARKATGRRGPPSGGLDFVKISSMWKAQGKPGDWQSFIRQNSGVRKK